MMVKLVLLVEATISEAAHSVLKAVIIVICPFRSSKEFLRGKEARRLTAIFLFLASLAYYLIALIMSSTNLCCTEIDHFQNQVI